MTHNSKQKTTVNFKKARSLLSKIIDMVERDVYCIDVMQQNLAVIGLLRSAHKELMESHLKHCFAHAIESRDEKKKQDMIGEILKVNKLFNK